MWQEYKQLPARFTKQLSLEVLNQALAAFATIIAAKAGGDSPSAGELCPASSCRAAHAAAHPCPTGSGTTLSRALPAQCSRVTRCLGQRGCQPGMTTLSGTTAPETLWPACHQPRGPADMLRAGRGDSGGLGTPAAGPSPHDRPHQCAAAPAASALVRDPGQPLLPAGQPCMTGCVTEHHADFVRHLRHGAMTAAGPQDHDTLLSKQARALVPMTPFLSSAVSSPAAGKTGQAHRAEAGVLPCDVRAGEAGGVQHRS